MAPSPMGEDMAEQGLSKLVAAARKGDSAAFGRIVEVFQRMVYGYAYALLGDFQAAEDVAQDSFLEAYKSLGRLRDAAAFPGWLKRIVRHCSNRARRRKMPGLVSLEECGQAAALATTSARPSPHELEVRDAVREAVALLPQPQRDVTTLFYIDGYSQEEIARFLDVPVNTVKSRLHAARTRLKERMVGMVRTMLKEHRLSDDFMKSIQERLGHPISEEEHKRWHRDHPKGRMTGAQHRALMRKMGVGEEEDRKWHEKHALPRPRKPASR